MLGRYRKSHIPDGPGYQEKFYFHPGDSGFKTWQTRYGRLGAAICWLLAALIWIPNVIPKTAKLDPND